MEDLALLAICNIFIKNNKIHLYSSTSKYMRKLVEIYTTVLIFSINPLRKLFITFLYTLLAT